jgi:hypothetical protein
MECERGEGGGGVEDARRLQSRQGTLVPELCQYVYFSMCAFCTRGEGGGGVEDARRLQSRQGTLVPVSMCTSVCVLFVLEEREVAVWRTLDKLRQYVYFLY